MIFLRYIKEYLNLSCGAYSIKGRKAAQEDSWYISPMQNNTRLVFVADGVGGHKHGSFASNLCVETYKNDFEKWQDKANVKNFLEKTAYKVGASLLNKATEDTDYKNAGTTISGFVYKKDRFYTINIGDSRVYYMSNNKLTRATKDHSVVQELMDKGLLSEEEAMMHPRKNIMTSALGQELNQIKIDAKGPYKLKKKDILLACSDGVHDALNDEQIKQILLSNLNPKEIAKKLVETAYNAGGMDNITACVFIY